MNWIQLIDTASTILTVTGGASVLAAWLPRPPAGTSGAAVFRALDLVAQNYLNARNKA